VVFAADGTHAALSSGSSIDLFDLESAGSVTRTTLTGTRSDPRFSPRGEFLYYADGNDTGSLRSTQDPSGTGFVIDEFADECPLVWTGRDRFVYQQCRASGRGVAEGIIADGALSTTVHNDSLRDNLVIGAAQRCFVNRGARELDVGRTELPLSTEFTRSAQVEISLASLSPRDNAVVWVEDATDVYWLPLNSDCTVSTLPTLVHSNGAIDSVAFVAEWP
jgi:hypothetical protein